MSSGSWFQVSPFGRFQCRGGTVVFDQAAANVLRRAFDQAKAASAHWRGVPIYVGDPIGNPKLYADSRKYGSILSLQVRADGLYAEARWSQAGRELVENEAFGYSDPHWDVRPLPGQPGILRPVQLLSVGLTNFRTTDGKPIAANETTAENHAPTMSREQAAERWHRLIYQQVMTSREPREKAWAYCQKTFPQAYADYAAENAANTAATAAANEAALAARKQRAEDRASRMKTINEAVDERLAVLGNDKPDSYGRAFASVQRERPELFAGMDTPAENTAGMDKEARLEAIRKGVAAMRKRYPNGGDAYDAFKAQRPELFDGFQDSELGRINHG